MSESKPLFIGIDPGVQTGIGIWDKPNKFLMFSKTTNIIKAMGYVMIHREFIQMVRIEDARLRKWFGNSGREKLQGVGSIKRMFFI